MTGLEIMTNYKYNGLAVLTSNLELERLLRHLKVAFLGDTDASKLTGKFWRHNLFSGTFKQIEVIAYCPPRLILENKCALAKIL